MPRVSVVSTVRGVHRRSFTRHGSGTISLRGFPIGFDKWLPAIWLLTANRNGISSCELARGLGVTQKTA